jgi:hypothetical protein
LRGVTRNVARVLHGVETEPRSAFIALDSTNSADYRCAVCHLCAATPVEVSLWHEKSGRSSGVDGARGWCVYTTATIPKTKKRKYLNQTHCGPRGAQRHLNNMLGERDRGRNFGFVDANSESVLGSLD